MPRRAIRQTSVNTSSIVVVTFETVRPSQVQKGQVKCNSNIMQVVIVNYKKKKKKTDSQQMCFMFNNSTISFLIYSLINF